MLSKISLTQNNLRDILDAFEHFFPSGTIYSADKSFTSISGEYSWPNRNGFIDFIYRLTDIKIGSDRDFSSMKEAQQKLTNMVIGAEEKTELNSTLPDEEARALQEKEAKIRKDEVEKTKIKAERDVEEKLKNLQKRREQLSQKESVDEKWQQNNKPETINEPQTIDTAPETGSQPTTQTIPLQQDMGVARKSPQVITDSSEEYKSKIEELQKIEPELRNKVIYAKIEAPPTEKFDANIQNFIAEAKAHPLEFRNAISNNIKESILSGSFSDTLSREEISIIADKTANDIVFAINNPSIQTESNYQTAILNSLTKADTVIDSLTNNAATKDFLKNGPSEVAFYQNSSQLSRDVLSSYNQRLAEAVFGPDPQNISVTFYETPSTGYTHNINLGEVNKGYTNLVQTQSEFKQQLGSLGQDKAKQFVLGRARSFLDKQVAKLPAQSLLKGAYNSSLGQKALNLVGLSKTSLFSESLLGNVLSKIPGASNFIQSVASKIGVDLGFLTISTTSALIEAPPLISTGISTTSTVATRGAGTSLKSIAGRALVKIAPKLAAKLGIGAAAGAAVGTATGAGSGFLAGLVTGPGAIITAIIGALIGLIKAFWPKIKEFFNTYGVGIGAVLLGGGFITGSPILIATGAPILIFTVPVVGGLKAATAKLGGLLKIVLAALVIHIGKPVLITVLCVPVVVAFILLVINSGAYVTPPGSHTGTINIECNATGAGLTAESAVANAAICIVLYLDQFNLNPLTGTLIGSPAWRELEAVLARPASDALKVSAIHNSWLQCVGFSSATAGLAFGSAFGQINACSYIGNAPSGYTYYSGTSGIQSGDFFLMDGSGGCSSSSPGHIGVVVSVDGALISCADANAVAPGKARASHGCYALSQLKGYFRKQ